MSIGTILDPEELFERYPEQAVDLARVIAQIEELCAEDRVIVYRALERYWKEGADDTYRAEPGALVRCIQDKQLLEDSDDLIDLGAGPGDLVAALANANPFMDIRGVDLSPTFVDNFCRRNFILNASMSVGLIDRPLPDIFDGNNSSAISILTLDRLSNPIGLVENMARCNKAKAIGTLLPIRPVDDNPSLQANKTVYTRPEMRIVPGRDADEDREALLKLLRKQWKQPVDFTEVDYVVDSSGDRQPYNLGVFYTS